MKKVRLVLITALTIFLGMGIMASANAKEPVRPVVNIELDSYREAKISKVKNLKVDRAFEMIQGEDFLVDKDLMNRAIFLSFKDRKKDALTYAIEYLKKPRREIIDGEAVDRASGLYVARKVLQIFPDESLDSLLDLYEHSDPAIRANVIVALGGMEGDPVVRILLVEALDDKAIFYEEDPEEYYSQMEGIPLRVCDEAYNQLVLRYEVKNVLRTIGNAHAIEDRDYQIEVLKSIIF